MNPLQPPFIPLVKKVKITRRHLKNNMISCEEFDDFLAVHEAVVLALYM